MPNSSICEVSSDEESPEVVMVPHFFQNRRKSCYSWRMRQRENGRRYKTVISKFYWYLFLGYNKNNSRASVDSEVFEIIHLDENNEEVSNRDKLITGPNIIKKINGSASLLTLLLLIYQVSKEESEFNSKL